MGFLKLRFACISIKDPVCISVLKRNTVSIVNTSLSLKNFTKNIVDKWTYIGSHEFLDG